MPGKVNDRTHHASRDGGRPRDDGTSVRPLKPARNRSRVDVHPGQGSEGFSKGYGGSAGSGATGPSGPEDDNTR